MHGLRMPFLASGDEYIALAPIRSDGKQYAAGDKNGISSIMRNEAEITKFCKHPEVAPAGWISSMTVKQASELLGAWYRYNQE